MTSKMSKKKLWKKFLLLRLPKWYDNGGFALDVSFSPLYFFLPRLLLSALFRTCCKIFHVMKIVLSNLYNPCVPAFSFTILTFVAAHPKCTLWNQKRLPQKIKVNNIYTPQLEIPIQVWVYQISLTDFKIKNTQMQQVYRKTHHMEMTKTYWGNHSAIWDNNPFFSFLFFLKTSLRATMSSRKTVESVKGGKCSMFLRHSWA